MKTESDNRKGLIGMYSVIFIAYIFVNFHRYAGGVSASILVEEFKLNPAQVGLFGAVFTYCYAFMNLPAGLLIDKFGSRKLIGILYILAALGSVAVAVTDNFTVTLIGRAMIAIGIAPVYASASKALATWEKPERYSLLNGALMSSGRAGGIIASTPLIFLIGAMGWRNTYLVIAVVSVVVGIGALLLVKDKATSSNSKASGSGNPFNGLGKLIAQPQYWFVLVFMISLNSTTVNIFANWGGVFLTQGMGFAKEVSGNILLMGSIAAVLGGIISGYISSKKSARFAGFIGQGILVIAVGVLAFFTERLSLSMYYAVFIAIGLVEMYVIAAGFSLIRTLATPKHIGAAFGTGNFIIWTVGSGVAQLWGMWIPEDFALSGFTTALQFHFGLVLLGLICLFFIKEKPIRAFVEER